MPSRRHLANSPPRAARALRTGARYNACPPRPARPPRANRRRASATSRDAFTLVEVVVAIVLLATAALDVAATSTYLARLAASARAVALATRETANVVDSLRTIPCASLNAGTTITTAGTVRWTITTQPGTRDIRAVLTPRSRRVRQPVIEEALLPCD